MNKAIAMLRLLPALLLLLGLPHTALAKRPCKHLKGDALKTYNQLGKDAADHYKNGDFLAAIDTINSLKAICDEDPRLDFNLARAYQKSGNCNMARYWFEAVLTHPDADELSKKQPKLALEAIATLENQCKDSTRVAVSCGTPNTQLELLPKKKGEPLTVSCPFSGRVDAGHYTVRAMAEGYTPAAIQVDIAREENNALYVPPLFSADDGFARLMVPCSPGEKSFELDGPAGTESHACPAELRLPAGTYGLSSGGGRQEVRLDPKESMVVQTEILDPGFGLEGWGWLAIGMGTTFLATSIGLHVLANDLVFDITEAERDGSGTVVGLTQQQAQDIQGRAETINTVAIVGDVLGGALIATGIVLLLLPEDNEQDLTIAPEISREHLMLRVTRRF